MSELRECPKCWKSKDNDIEVFVDDSKLFRVWCFNCGFQTCGYETQAEAIEAWNTRAPDPRLQEAVREIKTQKACEYGVGWEEGYNDAMVAIIETLHKHIPESKEE